MLRIAKEIVTRLDILVNHIVLMTVSQSSCSLQNNTSELIEVAVQVVVAKGTTTQILHQFIVAILSINIGLTIVDNLDYHL